ncbi:MAG: Wzz/FepE/Etk N-terminal domain-containing protein [Flavobacteriales bacterium]
MENIFDFKKFLAVLNKWKKHLIFVFIASILLSALFSSSLFIKPKYKSTAVLYPTNTKPYGTETPVEQMLQVLEANEIRDEIIRKYDLLKHYDIDSTSNPHFYSDVVLQFAENISFTKTKYESVELEVKDTDPELALKITYSIIKIYNQKVRDINNSSLIEVARTLKERMAVKAKELDSLESKMKEIRVQYGILDYENQIRYLGENKKVTTQLNNPGTDEASSSLIKNLREQGGVFIKLRNDIDQARSVYNGTKFEYESAVKELNRDLNYTQLIVKPFKADRKCYPVRWLIVLISVFASMTLSLTLISFYEQTSLQIKNA